MSVKSSFPLSVLLFAAQLHLAAQILPAGWRYPEDRDYQGYWAEYRGSSSIPFHLQDDFDGNGMKDDAWILIGANEVKFGLFVFLNRGETESETVPLVVSGVGTQPYSSGLELVVPGRYPTACGKGYWPCAPTESATLDLTRPAIRLLTYEKASEIYYWDPHEQSFLTVPESD